MEGRSYLNNVISSYDQVTCLMDGRKAVDIVCLDFSKAFDTVSPGEAVTQWVEQVHSLLYKELDGVSGPEAGGEWS